MYRLAFLNNKLKGKRITVKQGTVLIGRSPECQLDLDDDEEVSRQHAVLEQRSDGVYIRDLGSTNKIGLNGRKIDEARLQHGDQVEIGRTLFQFQYTHRAESSTRRRLGWMQLATFAAIVVVLVLELVFLVRLSLWRSDDLSADIALVKPPEPTVEELIKQEVPKSKTRPSAPVKAPENPPSAAVPPTPPPEQVKTEVTQLRQEMDELRKQVEDLAAPPAPAVAATNPVEGLVPPVLEKTAVVPVAATKVTGVPPVAAVTAGPEIPPLAKTPPAPAPPPAPNEPIPQEDTVTQVAREMLKVALREIAGNDLREADVQLERIQIMAPDFVPAYVERARVFERQGHLNKAGDQWGEVLKRSMGTPLYAEAAAERIRLARNEMATSAAARTDSRDKDKAFALLPRKIRIDSADPEKFQTNDEFDEMRLLRVVLKAKVSDREIDSSDVKVSVIFFDRDEQSGQLNPTRVLVPEDSLQLEGPWNTRQLRNLSVAYIVPKGFRKDEQGEFGEKRNYYGFVIRVYYLNELQDVNAKPRDLLQRVPDLTSPLAEPVASL